MSKHTPQYGYGTKKDAEDLAAGLEVWTGLDYLNPSVAANREAKQVKLASERDRDGTTVGLPETERTLRLSDVELARQLRTVGDVYSGQSSNAFSPAILAIVRESARRLMALGNALGEDVTP